MTSAQEHRSRYSFELNEFVCETCGTVVDHCTEAEALLEAEHKADLQMLRDALTPAQYLQLRAERERQDNRA